ncbi:MAG TPA: hypothetical protein VKB19_02285, partial [Pedobacter sp.]|nr:hypothetical protein [Pedobacter sp.]
MNSLLKEQYALLKESRGIVFRFLEEEVQQDILCPVGEFNRKTVVYMLVHIANTYLAWAGVFALKSSHNYYSENEHESLTGIRKIFNEIDEIMAQFLETFNDEPTKAVSGYKWEDKFIETDALAIFTHV